jgi:hypothetical protein
MLPRIMLVLVANRQVICSSAPRTSGQWVEGTAPAPMRRPQFNALVKEPQVARRLASATSRKQPWTSPHAFRCGFQCASI